MKLRWSLATIAVALLVACDKESFHTRDRACRPSWSGDCWCMSDQVMDHAGDGLIICRSAADGGR